MTCPTCSKPLLFGSLECSCGWQPAVSAQTALEPTYWESLAIFWRIYWISGLFVLSAIFVLAMVLVLITSPAEAQMLLNQPVVQIAMQQVFSAIAIFLFAPLLTRWRYRRFSAVIVTDSGIESKFSLTQRFQVTVFLLWRWIVASLVTGFAVAPISIFFGLFGLSTVSPVIFLLATVLGAGPLIVRFLIGHQFSSFRLEIVRGSHLGPSTAAEEPSV